MEIVLAICTHSIKPAAQDFGAPHRRHAMFRAKTKSPQCGHAQSPGFALAMAATPLGKASPCGRFAPHFRQSTFAAKMSSKQLGQTQSPGLTSIPVHPEGRAVAHVRHAVFFAKTKSR